MTVEINLVYIIGLILYSVAVTGFWVCAIVGAGKEAQDRLMGLQIMKDGCKAAEERAKELRGENEKLRKEKRHLAEQYIKMQNEYGWFRQMVRALDPGAVRSAEARIREQKAKKFPADRADKSADGAAGVHGTQVQTARKPGVVAGLGSGRLNSNGSDCAEES